MTVLSTNQQNFRHPVRLLFIDAALPSILALAFNAEASRWTAPLLDSDTANVIDFADEGHLAGPVRS